jgi:putrescine aminotransferase
VIEQRDELYGAASPQELAAETYENYKRFVNPPLARVMKLSGSPVEVRAEGATIWDQTGKAYLDFAGGYGVFTLGHRHPRVLEAVRAQLDLIALSGKTMFNVVLGRASRRLAELAPGDLEITFWCNSGTEAIEGAIKLARAATGRAKIVGTIDAYHGKTLGALSVSGRETFQSPFRPLLADSACIPYGETSMLDEALAGAAAFVVEPVQGEGGVNVPPLGYMRAVREACDRSGAVFVADEVQTGLGRCGYRFACDRDGVVPDVMTLAKGLSGGVIPVGAFIARPSVWNRAFAHAPLLHTSTFGGSELACAAALAAMDVLEDEGLAYLARLR